MAETQKPVNLLRASARLRALVAMMVVPLPSCCKTYAFRTLFGWSIAPTAKIGISYVAATDLVMGEDARIGHLSVFRDVRVVMGVSSGIGNWNWVSSARAFTLHGVIKPNESTLVLGDHSFITSRHYIDASGGVVIGAFSTIAGVRSTILTHQIDLRNSVQSLRSVHVGNYCFISSNVCLVPGAVVGDRAVVAMGAVVVGHLEGGQLHGGVPAQRIPSDIASGRYFVRLHGVVGVSGSEVASNPEED